MNAAGHQIDVFGIGTNLVTCQAQPALGMVYKVCEFKGVPRLKLSEEPEKTTVAGAKSVLRAFNKAGAPMFDVLCLASEYESILDDPASVCPSVYDRIRNEVAVDNPFSAAADGETSFGRLESVTVDLYSNSTFLLGQIPSLQERQQTVASQLSTFGGYDKLIKESKKYEVYLSPALMTMQKTLLERLRQ